MKRVEKLKPIVRFAPSPTGFLHIGGARTALFNWLFARHHGGKFLLRIEDTDQKRSSASALKAIFESLAWLELIADEDPVFQFERASRHVEVAENLVSFGKAYYCNCPPKLFDEKRYEENKEKPGNQQSACNCKNENLSKSFKTVIRLIAENSGETTVNDLVQGEVKIKNSQLDDMVLLRSDGTPTYMLSVVVDDHDMEITHIIRGTDHLTNTFRQKNLYAACGWRTPEFAHIPLIYGCDGTKLSKRHGAISTEEYQKMGILPEAMRNYLLRLGWGHANLEIIETEKAIELFDILNVGKSPARFDFLKLMNLNGFYLRSSQNEILLKNLKPFIIYEIFNNIINSVNWNESSKIKEIVNDLDSLEKLKNIQPKEDLLEEDLFDFSDFFKNDINKLIENYLKESNKSSLTVLTVIKILKKIENNFLDENSDGNYYANSEYDLSLLNLFTEILNSTEFKLGFKNVINGIFSLKERAKNLNELAKNSLFYFKAPNVYSQKFFKTAFLIDSFKEISSKETSKNLFENFEIYEKTLEIFIKILPNLSQKTDDEMLEICKVEAEKLSIKLQKFIEPIRLALTGQKISPSIFNIINVLKNEEVLKRVENFMSLKSKNL